MANNRILLESSATDGILLEDGSGVLLLDGVFVGSIPSGETFGTPNIAIANIISPDEIASGEQVGSPGLVPLHILPGSVYPSADAFQADAFQTDAFQEPYVGIPTLLATAKILPASVPAPPLIQIPS